MRCRPINHVTNPFRICSNPLCRNNMPQVLDTEAFKTTFLPVHPQVVPPKDLKNLQQMIPMSVLVVTIYIKLSSKKTKANLRKHGLNTSFISDWKVEGAWHHEEFIMALMCSERSLVDVCFFHPNLVVTRFQIQLREHHNTS